jgi:hypothetical protein
MTTEHIICAAIHYFENKAYIHQPRNIELGYVMCGRRHHNIINLRFDLTGKRTADRSGQGFLTNTDRFVDRQEAYKIARDAGQLLLGDYQTAPYILTSEDLY